MARREQLGRARDEQVEIGDITRFARPGRLCSWGGLTPKHHESDATVVRGHVTKQG